MPWIVLNGEAIGDGYKDFNLRAELCKVAAKAAAASAAEEVPSWCAEAEPAHTMAMPALRARTERTASTHDMRAAAAAWKLAGATACAAVAMFMLLAVWLRPRSEAAAVVGSARPQATAGKGKAGEVKAPGLEGGRGMAVMGANEMGVVPLVASPVTAAL